MHVDITPATRADAPLLRALLQLYSYDFSELVGADVGADGRFAERPLEPLWDDAWRHPFLLEVGGRHAGFAFVSERSRITGESGISDVAEFFVLRKYRRGGVGARAATHLFDRFPGRWEVRQIHANVAATAFWRKVIGAFTSGRFDEIVYDDARWRGPVQAFTTPLRPPGY